MNLKSRHRRIIRNVTVIIAALAALAQLTYWGRAHVPFHPPQIVQQTTEPPGTSRN
jgi:hypothetical protein